MNAAVHDDAIDRRALKSVAVQFFANGATYATIIPRLPEIREQVDISISTLGLVLTVGSIASLIGSAFAGRVTARIGSRRVMIFGGVMSVAFPPIIGFATSPIVLALALFGLLFFDIVIDVATPMIGRNATDITPPKIITRRLPIRAVTRPANTDPIKLAMLPTVRTSPRVLIEMSTCSRISGSRGMIVA